MNCQFSWLHFFEMLTLSELDALGDELLADEDSSYLDEAASAPAIPEGVPTDTKNKVKAFSIYIFYASCQSFMLDHQSGNLKGTFKLVQGKTFSLFWEPWIIDKLRSVTETQEWFYTITV